MTPILKPAALLPLLATNPPVLLDARTGPEAHQHYEALHLAGARYVDLERDLAAEVIDAADGGRHPLPAPARFARLLGRLGISRETPVVVYDDAQGANAAARCWWMLRAAGHSAVQVLDGGLKAGLAAGLPTASGPEVPASQASYDFQDWALPTVDADGVAQALLHGGLVIDVRDARRFRGEVEPIDLVAGHIPGAVNAPFAHNLDANGQFLPPSVLRQHYLALLDQRHPADVIVHCGSGVTACHTLLALAHAGLDLPKLYVGSWGEWSRNPRPQATGE